MNVTTVTYKFTLCVYELLVLTLAITIAGPPLLHCREHFDATAETNHFILRECTRYVFTSTTTTPPVVVGCLLKLLTSTFS